jgi:replicative DNA helicase
MTDGNCKQVEAIDGLLGSAVDRMKERMATPDKLPGVSTGFCELDTLLCGLQKTDLIILAARPSMGKTALCLNIAGQVAIRERQPVLFFSLEMSKDQLAQRLLCTEAGIDAQRVRGGYMNEKDLAKAVKTKAALADVPLYIDDSPNPGLIEMQAKARQLMAKLGNQPLGLVVVDYMQLMSSPMGNKRDLGNRVNEVGAISRGMKGLAKGLDCPVLVLSQLSRAVEQRADKRPMLSDLRESGSIEQDADVVMFIYRDEYYNPEETDCPGMADIIVAKQRNGPVGTIPLVYRNSTTQFMNPVKSYNSSF